MQKIKETIKSAVGFYIGDAKRIAPDRLKNDIAQIVHTGGGKIKDKGTGHEVAATFIGSSIIHGPYIANNGQKFDVETNRFILLPLELAPTVDKLNGTSGVVVIGPVEATLEADDNFIKITFPSTEVIEIYRGRSRQ